MNYEEYDVPTDELPLIEFTAHDRCDRCQAQALSLAYHFEHGELMFCLHHRKEHAQNMLDEGWTIIDDYEAIERLSTNQYLAPL